MRVLLQLIPLWFLVSAAIAAPRSPEYGAVQHRLATGWNTWDTHSVAAQVLLPEAFTIRLGLKHNTALNADRFLADALIGRREPGAEEVIPGAHTWNGSYTQLRLKWHGHELVLETGHIDADLVMLVTPIPSPTETLPATAVISAGVLWNRPGSAALVADHIEFSSPTRHVGVYCTGTPEVSVTASVDGPFFARTLRQPIGISTGRPRTIDEIEKILRRVRPVTTGVPNAIETVLGWDTIYEPTQNRVITPVSRIWCLNWGGYVLFDWDTFFAASLAATENRDLAYANALEILRESTAEGFVPNYGRAAGWKSVDRSEPPVGAITILELYRKFREPWLLRDSFEALLQGNRWWAAHRDVNGYLVWGSDPDVPPRNPDDGSVGTKQGAMYESGLDNSPMFDGAPFDPATHRLRQADVGLMGLYIADCNALAEIAEILGRKSEANELKTRSLGYGTKLQSLWDERFGLFLNKNLDTGELSRRISPTNFYPLVARVPSPAQAERMVRDHLLNPQEFWGEWVIPSIARSDPAFRDQEYWRGRIWGPMNYLVDLGLRNYGFADIRKQLAAKSLALFDHEWTTKGHVHENYNAITGDGDDVSSSDRFYHWGALLGLISLDESER